MPTTVAGELSSSNVCARTPVPHPTSSQRALAGGASHWRKMGATARLGSNPAGRARIRLKIKRLPQPRQALFFSASSVRDFCGTPSSHTRLTLPDRFRNSGAGVVRGDAAPSDDPGDPVGPRTTHPRLAAVDRTYASNHERAPAADRAPARRAPSATPLLFIVCNRLPPVGEDDTRDVARADSQSPTAPPGSAPPGFPRRS